MKKFALISLIVAAPGAWGDAYPGFGFFGGASIPAGTTASAAGFHLGSSALVGGCLRMATSDIGDIELAGAYHPRHRPKGFSATPELEDAKMTITPVTLGTNGTFKVAGNVGFRLGVGAGFYVEKLFEKGTAETTEGPVAFQRLLEIDRAGFYANLGPVVQLQGFALEVTGRFHYVINEDDYNYKYTEGGPPLPATYHKGYNDMFTDITVGVSYYFLPTE